MSTVHQSVLLNEVIQGLDLGKGKRVVIDGTFGGGGHSLAILEQFPETKIIAIDEDIGAWERGKSKFADFTSRISFQNGNFRELDRLMSQAGEKKADAIILDLGLSSDQLDNSGRGFTFKKDEPLEMTMKENPSETDVTAKDIVNTWERESIEEILRGYGEEHYAGRIARVIVEERQKKMIGTTGELVRIIEKAVPSMYRRSRIHFATRTFQALRIAVNDELRALKEGLVKGYEVLSSGGRMAVISFHSHEDRIVKNFFREKDKEGEIILINKKPIVATEEELKNNPRSRSAKLRIMEKK